MLQWSLIGHPFQHLRDTSKENVRLLEKQEAQQKLIACREVDELSLKQGGQKACTVKPLIVNTPD